MAIKRNVSNKIYEVILLVTAIFAILNIVGIWITWNNLENPIGYVFGALCIVGLIASTVLAFLNEKPLVRKQALVWLVCFVLHLVFFIVGACLIGVTDTAVFPALFTAIIVLMILVLGYVLLKDRLFAKTKPYTFASTSDGSNEVKTQQPHEEPVETTQKVSVQQHEDKTPVAGFKPSEPKPEPKPQPEETKPIDDLDGIIKI